MALIPIGLLSRISVAKEPILAISLEVACAKFLLNPKRTALSVSESVNKNIKGTNQGSNANRSWPELLESRNIKINVFGKKSITKDERSTK